MAVGGLSERLAFILSLDADGAIRGFRNVGDVAERELGRADNRLDRVGGRMQSFGAGAVAAAGVAGAALFSLGQDAAQLEQAAGGTEAVFGELAGTIEEAAEGAARAAGLSERAFREATTSIGGNLKRMGFDVEAAADQSIELTQVAADLAATYGGTTAEAVAALGAAFRGEADPAERFNLNLKASAVNARAVELGLAANTSEVSENAKAQALLSLIMEQSADAQGQFAREADTASGSMAIAAAEAENMRASLGEAIAPVIADVSQKLAGFVGWVRDANEETGGAVGKFAAYATAAVGAAGALSFVAGSALKVADNLAPRNIDTGARSLTRLGKVASGVAGVAGIAGVVTSLAAMSSELNDLEVDVAEFATATAAELDRLVRPEVLEFMGHFEVSVEDIARQLVESNVPAAERFAEALERNGQAADGVRQIIEEKRQQDQQAAVDQQAYAEAIDSATDSTDANSTAVRRNTSEQERNKKALEDRVESLRNSYEATLGLFDAEIKHREAQRRSIEAQNELNDVIDEHGRNSWEARAATDATVQALDEQARAAVDLFQQTAELNGETLEAGELAAIHRQALENMRGEVSGPVAAALDAHIARLAAIPRTITTTVGVRTVLESEANRDEQTATNLRDNTKSTVNNITINGVGSLEVAREVERAVVWGTN